MSARRPLGILCGGGALPLEAAREARANGREIFLIGLVGSASSDIEAYDHVWVKIGELGKLIDALNARGVDDLALLGPVARPEFADIKFDWGAVKRAGDIAKLFVGGDNTLLQGVAGLLEREGLKIVGVADFAPQLLAPVGRIAGRTPDAATEADIDFGKALLAAMSPFDVGQGAVIASQRTLAVEAAEGTNAMLARVAEMRASRRLKFKGRAGVLVKAAKRGQDLRLDLPTVGTLTIEAAARAKLAGVAIAARHALIVGRHAFIAEAEAAGLFVVGFEP
jgi:UDP-2,3-diacylglucosamine hydrolase